MLHSFVAKVPKIRPATTPIAVKRDFSASLGLATGCEGDAPRATPPAGMRCESGSELFTPTDWMERTSRLTLTFSVLRPRSTTYSTTKIAATSTSAKAPARIAPSMPAPYRSFGVRNPRSWVPPAIRRTMTKYTTSPTAQSYSAQGNARVKSASTGLAARPHAISSMP